MVLLPDVAIHRCGARGPSAGSAGTVRSGQAWICDFSSTARTRACSGRDMYRSTTSRTYAMNSGSVLRFQDPTRWGLGRRPARSGRPRTGDRPVSAAIDRVDQCVSWPGPFSVRVRLTSTSTWSLVIFRGAPGRGASASPPSRPSTNQTRHWRTDSPRHPGPSRHRRQRRDPVLLCEALHDRRPHWHPLPGGRGCGLVAEGLLEKS